MQMHRRSQRGVIVFIVCRLFIIERPLYAPDLPPNLDLSSGLAEVNFHWQDKIQPRLMGCVLLNTKSLARDMRMNKGRLALTVS